MAQKIEFIWECPACLYGNKVEIKKPGHVSPSLFSATCKYCKSVVQTKVALAPGKTGQLQYCFTELQLSPAGKHKAEKRLKEEKNHNPAQAETRKDK